MEREPLRAIIEAAIHRLEVWATTEERYERELAYSGGLPRELGPDAPLTKNINHLIAQLRRAIGPE